MKNLLNLGFYTIIAIILSSCSACSGKKGGGGNPPVGNVGNAPKEIEVVRLGDLYTNQGVLPIPFQVGGTQADLAVGELFSDDECTLKIDDIVDFTAPYNLNAVALNAAMNVYLKVLVDSVEKVACELVATVNHSDVPPDAPEISSTAFDIISNQFPSIINFPNNGGPLSIDTNGIIFPPGLIKKLLILSPTGSVVAEIPEEDIGSTVDLNLDLSSLGEDTPLGINLGYEDAYGNQSDGTTSPAITVVRTSAPVVDIDSNPTLSDNLANGFVGESHSIPVASNRPVDYSVLVDGVDVATGNGSNFNIAVTVPGEDGSSITYDVVTVDEFGNESTVTIGPLFQVPFSVSTDILPAVQSLLDTRFTDFTPAQIDLATNRQANFTVRVGGTANGITGASAVGAISFNHAFGGLVDTPDVVDVVVTDSYGNERTVAIGTFNPPLFEVNTNYDTAFLDGLAGDFDGPNQTIELTTNRAASFNARVGGASIATGSSAANAISVPVEITGINGQTTTVVTTVIDSYGNEIDITTGPMSWFNFEVNENYDAAILDGVSNGFDDENQTIDLTVTRPATFIATVGGVEIANGSSVDGDISFPVVLNGVHGQTTTVVVVVTDSYGNEITVITPAFEMNQFVANFNTATLALLSSGFTELNPVVVIESNRDYTYTATGPLAVGSESGDQDSTVTLEVPGVFSERELLSITLEDRFGNTVTISDDVFMQEASVTLSQATIDNFNGIEHNELIINIAFDINVPYQSVQLIDTDNGNSVRDETALPGVSGAGSFELNLVSNNVFNGFVRTIDFFGNVVDGINFSTSRNNKENIQVEAGANHTCALHRDGSVRCWGNGTSGQLGQGSSDNLGDDEPVSSINPLVFDEKVTKIAAGGFHTCVLLESGRVKCWGRNVNGQLGFPDGNSRGITELATTLPDVDIGSPVLDIYAGSSHTCAIISNNSIKCWGNNISGELGLGNADPVSLSSTPAGIAAVVFEKDILNLSVSSITSHNCAVFTDGSVKCWGRNTGQLGIGNLNIMGDNEIMDQIPLTSVDSTNNSTIIVTGNLHTCSLLDNQNFKCWGTNNYGQLGYPNTTIIGDTDTPNDHPQVNAGVPVISMSAGNLSTCLLTSLGNVRCFGDNRYGAMGLKGGSYVAGVNPSFAADTLYFNEPVSNIPDIDLGGVEVSGLTSGNLHSCILSKQEGKIICFGDNRLGQLGYGDTISFIDSPGAPGDRGFIDFGMHEPDRACRVSDLENYRNVTSFSGNIVNGDTSGCTVESCSTEYYIERNSCLHISQQSVPEAAFDDNFLAQSSLGFTELNPTLLIDSGRNFTYTATGPLQAGSESGNQDSVIVLDVPGTSSSGQQVTITIEDEYGNVSVLTRDIFMQNANPELSQATINNYDGQGHYETVISVVVDINVPYQSIQLIDTDNGNAVRASTVGAGGAGSPSIELDLSSNNVFNGFVRVIDSFGNLIDGPSFNTYRNRWMEVSAGNGHTCAINELGRAYCWGYNSDGQLGNGDTTNSPTPVAVLNGEGLGLSGVKSISAGFRFTCAINTSDQVFCWGLGSLLGNGGTASSSTPVAVLTGEGLGTTGVKAISLGYTQACAINASGGVYCWGNGTSGQLGNGGTVPSSTPVAVLTGEGLGTTGVQSISGGLNHTCAINASGRAYCWGYNSDGQLGNGGTALSSTPVAVLTGEGLGTTGVQSISCNQTGSVCALNSSGQVFCWGNGLQGQLGNGDTINSSTPVAVLTGEGLGTTGVQSISTGGGQSCAISEFGQVFCWGSNYQGQAGNGIEGAGSLLEPEKIEDFGL